MAKYSKGAQEGVKSAMKRMEKGTLRSGKSGKKVTNPKQAIAIGLSEAKEKGAKVPAKKSTAKAPKKAVKKPTLKKATAKKVDKKTSKKQAIKASVKKTGSGKKVVAKKAVSLKKLTQTTMPDQNNLTVAEKSINKKPTINTAPTQVPVEEKSLVILPKADDPIMKVDKNLLKRITTKRDLHHNIQLSQSKSPIRPSGKKPLFNR